MESNESKVEDLTTLGAYGFDSWDDLFRNFYASTIMQTLVTYSTKRYTYLKRCLYLFDSYLIPYLRREELEEHESYLKSLFDEYESNLKALKQDERESKREALEWWLFNQFNNHTLKLMLKIGKLGSIAIRDNAKIDEKTITDKEKYEFHDKTLLYDAIKHKLSLNEDCIIAIAGKRGRGKSCAAVRMAYDIDKNFNFDSITMSAAEYSERVDDPSLSAGSAVIFDEAGVAASNRRWYSQTNKALVDSFETIRHRRLVLILTLPNLSHLDKHILNLVDLEVSVEEKGLDNGLKVIKGNWKVNDSNPSTGKLYKKWFRINTDMGLGVVKDFSVHHAPMSLWLPYEKKSRSIKNKIHSDSTKSINAEGDITGLTSRDREMYDDYNAKGMKQTAIAEKYGVTQSRVNRILKKIEKKGYSVK